MTPPFFLPVVALMASPAQDPQTIPPPVEQVAPAPEEAPPPLVAVVPPAANDDAPELRDPLADPALAEAPAPTTKPKLTRGDPLEGFNRAMFDVHQELDKAIYRPLAMGYKEVAPKPVRSGLRNFFSNLTEPIVFVNYLLQFRPGKAARTLARFTINSTIGIGGLVDVAKTKDFKLPHVSNGFGDTLAYYGVGPGPYLFLPLLGPSTLRDGLASPANGALLPVVVGIPFNRVEYQVASGILIGLDRRAEADPDLRALFDGAVDPYATLRSAYLQNRAAEVEALRPHKAAPDRAPEFDDPLTDPGADPPASDAPALLDPVTP